MRKFLATILFLLGLTLLFSGASVAQQPGNVLVLTAEGAVTPVMQRYIERGIEDATAQQAEALIIKLNTPGGQVDITREIIQTMISAPVPVLVYVSPAGGYAASAGTFIVLAGHVGAMAPQTSIGAASPISMQGEMDDVTRSKIENILVADMENLAARRGDTVVEWATKAVEEAEAANATEALELGIIDFIARDVDDLLTQADGFEVTLQDKNHTLNTADAPVVDYPMTFAENILAVLLRPEIAFMLLAIGPLAIIYELANPGGYIGGVIGLIALMLGLFAVGQLPTNFAGIGLLVLAFILFGAEVFTPTHGALSIAGVVSLIFSGLLLFDETQLGYEVSMLPIIATALVVGLFFFFIILKVVGALKNRPASGPVSMVGQQAQVKQALEPTGIVMAEGTRWQATLPDGQTATIDEWVEITAIEGLRLTVKKIEQIEQ